MEAAEAAMGPVVASRHLVSIHTTHWSCKKKNSAAPTKRDCPWHHSGFCAHGRTAQPNRPDLGCLLEWRHCQPLEVLEQLTYLLFIRRLDELKRWKNDEASALGNLCGGNFQMMTSGSCAGADSKTG